MAFYTCSKCLYCFERMGEIDVCPDCGRARVRFATDEEIAEHKQNRAETEGRGVIEEKV